MTISIDAVKTAHESWCLANTRVNARKHLERQRLERITQAEVIDVDVDLSDINNLYEEKGQGPHLLEMEFEPVTEAPVEYVSVRTGKNTIRWTWRHKVTQAEVNRYQTKSGKSFDTGVLSQHLNVIKEKQSKVAFERARHILKINGKKSSRTAQVSIDDMTVVKREDLLKQWVSEGVSEDDASIMMYLLEAQKTNAGASSFVVDFCCLYRFVPPCLA